MCPLGATIVGTYPAPRVAGVDRSVTEVNLPARPDRAGDEGTVSGDVNGGVGAAGKNVAHLLT